MPIRNALTSRLAAWAAAQSPVFPLTRIAFENASFTKPALDVTYLQAFLMPAGRAGKTFCSVEESGVFQVSIYTKPNGGTAVPDAISESLCAFFAPGMHPGFQILSPPYYSKGFNVDDGRFMTPVSIFYRASP